MKKKRSLKTKKYRSFKTVIAVAFLTISISSLLLAGFFQLFIYSRTQQKIIDANQRLIASDAADSVANFIQKKINRMETAVTLSDSMESSVKEQQSILYGLLGLEPSFQNLVILNTHGQIISSVSRHSSPKAHRYLNNLDIDFFSNATENVIGSIYIDKKNNEPMVNIAVSISGRLKNFKGLIIAEINLKFIWDFVAGLKVGKTGQTYVVNKEGVLIAAFDIARVIKGESITHIEKVNEFIDHSSTLTNTGATVYKGLTGERVIGTYIPLGIPQWAVITEMSVKEAYKDVLRSIIISVCFLLFTVFLAVGIGLLLARKISVPIIKLTHTASRIAAGEIGLRAKFEGPYEIVKLADAFNNMKKKLTTMLSKEESRTRQLQDEITNRKIVEKEIKEFAQRLSIHIEQTPLAVIEWDFDFKVIQWNQSAETIFGYSKKEAIGHTGLELIVPDEVHDHVQQIWDDLVSGQGGARSTNENLTKDRRSIICEWYNTTLLDDNGIVIGVASLVPDITDGEKFEEEKAKLEMQLQQSQKMEAIGTLAGGIAHDFNNILGIILGYSDILKTDLSLDSSSDEKFDAIIKAGNRAKDLVSQILAFSRQNKKEFISIQPDLIIKEALKMLRASIPTTIKIDSNVPKSGSIIGDPTQLHQIVMNLCTNAYHAMRDTGGVLEVFLESIELEENDTKVISLALPPGSYVKLEICDNGHGIDKITQQKIFDPYFTTKKKGEGTGLGLSVVHGIVKSFGGHISVYSEPDQGTTFRIYIPQHTSEVKTIQDSASEPNPTGYEHILLVDDEAQIVEMEKLMLESLGYKVSACTSSPEAFKVFQNQPEDIALVITDMTMPDMNGLQLLQRIRAIRSNIPVILCSGFSELINEEKAKHFDTLKYLKKPVLIRDLAIAVREILDNSKN